MSFGLDGIRNHPKADPNCTICRGGGILDDGENIAAIYVPCICTGECDPETAAKVRAAHGLPPVQQVELVKLSELTYRTAVSEHIVPGAPGITEVNLYPEERRIDWKNCQPVASDRPVRGSLVLRGSVIVHVRTNKPTAYAVGPGAPEAAIATSSLVVMQTGTRLDPSYLAWRISTRDWRPDLARRSKRFASRPELSYDDIAAVDIPLPSLEVQAKIGTVCDLIAKLHVDCRRRVDLHRQVVESYLRVAAATAENIKDLAAMDQVDLGKFGSPGFLFDDE